MNYPCSFFARVLFVAIALSQPGVAAGQSLLDDTRALLSAGQFNDAIANASELSETHPLDAALVLARANLELGFYEQAEIAAKRAVDLAPFGFDARFLLATALARQGRTSSARLQFRRAIDLATNEGQETLARNAIRNIAAERPVQFSGLFGLVPSTNFNKATRNDEVDLVFGTAEITSADPRGDIGVTYALGAEFSKLPGFALNLSGLYAENADERQATIGMTYDKDISDDQSISARYQSRWLGQDFYQNRLYLATTRRTELVDKISGGIELVSYASGERETDVFASATREIFRDQSFALNGELRVKRHSSDSANIASWAAGVSLWAMFETDRFDTQLAFSFNVRDWDTAAALFPSARYDQDRLISVVVSPKKTSFLGLKPALRASFLNRDSNISIYEIQSQDYYFGYETRF